jgi:AraC-like DNA-binding protein
MNLQYQQVTAEAARGIPVRRIVAKQQGADGSFDEWRDSIRPYHSSEPFEGGGAFTKIEAFNLGPLIAFRTKIGSQTMTGMVSPRQNQEFVRLRFFRSVSAKIMVGGFRCDVLPGRIYLLDYSREYWFSYAKCESLSFTIPHSLIGYDPQIHPPVIVSDPNTPQSSILRHTVETIFDNLPEMHLPEAAILAKGLIALLRLSISGALEEEHRDNFQKVRGRSMRRFLNQNLNAPELGIDMLLARFGAARATVYRDFEGVGGVSRYIADQRLERAYQELSSSAARRG